jgi:hypothetical protein
MKVILDEAKHTNISKPNKQIMLFFGCIILAVLFYKVKYLIIKEIEIEIISIYEVDFNVVTEKISITKHK